MLLNAWDSGKDRELNPKSSQGGFFRWLFASNHDDDDMVLRCRRDVWKALKPGLRAAAPKCWQKRGYRGDCDQHDAEGREGCRRTHEGDQVLNIDSHDTFLVLYSLDNCSFPDAALR